MSFADSTEPTRRHRRSLRGRVRSIEYNRRGAGVMEPVSRSYAAYVGRAVSYTHLTLPTILRV